jgi:hypothetical protein
MKSGVNKKAKPQSTPLEFRVPSLASVDARRLAGIKWPEGVNTAYFYPKKQEEKLYELLRHNIPAKYNVRLVYHARKQALQVPAPVPGGAGVRIEAARSRSVLLRDFTTSYLRDFLKLYYPKSKWRTTISESLKYFEKMPADMALRVVKGRTCAGLMFLLAHKYKGKPATLVGWVWLRKTLTISERRQVQHLMLSWLKRRSGGVVVAGVDGFNPGSQGFFRKAGFIVDRLNISRERVSHDDEPGKMAYPAWAKLYGVAWKAVEDADYKKAIDTLAPAYKRYPGDFKVVKTYAMALGDYADGLNGHKGRILKRRACAILGGLVRRLGGIRWEWNISTRNEYYYHSGQYKKQYLLGVESAAGGHGWGYYGQGVGAANFAYECAVRGRTIAARFWAGRAIAAWESFFKFKADYYNAYVHYALAFGVLGQLEKMEAALKKSATLSGKPSNYREFQEVKEKISQLRR